MSLLIKKEPGLGAGVRFPAATRQDSREKDDIIPGLATGRIATAAQPAKTSLDRSWSPGVLLPKEAERNSAPERTHDNFAADIEPSSVSVPRPSLPKPVVRPRNYAELIAKPQAEVEPEDLLAVFESSPTLSPLLAEARRVKPDLKVIFMEEKGVSFFEIGQIGIGKSLPANEKIAILAFELLNMINHQKFEDIQLAARLGIINKEEYVRAIEFLEYQNAIEHSKLMKQCIQREGWNAGADYLHWVGTFEDYFAAVKRKGHAPRYEQQYDQIHAIYDRHPPSAILQGLSTKVKLSMCSTLLDLNRLLNFNLITRPDQIAFIEQIARPPVVPTPLPSARPLSFAELIANIPDNHTPDDILKVLESSPTLREHLAEARRIKPDLKVSFVKKKEPGACCIFREGRIEIDESKPVKKKITALVFELANMINGQKVEDLVIAVQLGLLTKEEYIRAVEFIEYQHMQLHSKLMKQCIQNEGFDADMDCFRLNGDFEWHYAMQKFTGHSLIYEEYYDHIREACKNHPPALIQQHLSSSVKLSMCKTLLDLGLITRPEQLAHIEQIARE